jgi:effector-binding domain-containing protein
MPEFEIRHVPRHDAAVLHLTARPEAISETMGPAFGKLFESVGRSGGVPTGPVFARYFSMSEDVCDFECGVAVAAPFTGGGEVQASEIGGCEAAVGMHVGPYEELHETYAAMQAWLEAQGRKPSAVMWEVYLTDPDEVPDPAEWRTEVYWPVG